jgi:uncharacterized protein YjiS (DUF1127 family)
MTLVIVVDMRLTHNGNAAVCDEVKYKNYYNMSRKSKENKMLKRLFIVMIVARQASAAMQALQYISDSQLEDVGYTRDTFVEQIKANVLAELDAAHAKKTQAAPVNPNLVGAV